MKDNDIVKVFESLYKKLLNVKYDLKITQKEFLALNRVDTLIKRQQAEIERLRKYNTDVAFKHYNDGVKEFADRLKKSAHDLDISFGYGTPPYCKVVSVGEIDNLVKEMTEDGLDDRS